MDDISVDDDDDLYIYIYMWLNLGQACRDMFNLLPPCTVSGNPRRQKAPPALCNLGRQ